MKLAQKLSAISKSAGNIQKNGRYSYNTTQYNYLKIDDIYDHFNGPMSENGVVFTTNVLEWQIESNLIVGIIEGVFTDGEDTINCQVGSAARAGDKMMRNLMQNAVKQIFLQVFCISSGDPDPDGEPNTEITTTPAKKLSTISKDKFSEKVKGIADNWDGKSLQTEKGFVITSKGFDLLLSPLQFQELQSHKEI